MQTRGHIRIASIPCSLPPAGPGSILFIPTSSGAQTRRRQQKFVTFELTIFGLGSHSATGEERTDYDNAGTSTEAQAFKRACACFGLGRYLYYYYFDGV